MRKKILSILFSSLLIMSIFFVFIANKNANAQGYTNPYYVIGTSIMCGHPDWDPNHTSPYGIDQKNQPVKHTDDYLYNHSMPTNFSAWESNATQTTGWDAYNLAWGGGNMPINDMDETLEGTYGRATWRAPDDLGAIQILIMDHHHELGDGQTLDGCKLNCTAFYNWFNTNMPNCTLYTIGFCPDSSTSTRKTWTKEMAKWWDSYEEGKNNLVYVNITDYNLGLTTADMWQGDWEVDTTTYYQNDKVHLKDAGAKIIGEEIAKYILDGNNYNPPDIQHIGYSGSEQLHNESVMVSDFWVNWSYDTNGTPSYHILEICNNTGFISLYKTYNVTHATYAEGAYVNYTISNIVKSTTKRYMRVKSYYES